MQTTSTRERYNSMFSAVMKRSVMLTLSNVSLNFTVQFQLHK